jgi:hypothetical protein
MLEWANTPWKTGIMKAFNGVSCEGHARSYPTVVCSAVLNPRTVTQKINLKTGIYVHTASLLVLITSV